MKTEERSGLGRAVRRGVGLGLALTALWFLSLTFSPKTVETVLIQPDGCEENERFGSEFYFSGVPYFERRPGGMIGLFFRFSPYLSGMTCRLGGATHGGESGAEEEQDPEEDDQNMPELPPEQQETEIVEMTAKGKQSPRYIQGEGVWLYNRTDKELTPSVLTEGNVRLKLTEPGPQILIVHTHGSEAYAQTDGNRYEESDPYRTTDCTRNIVRVGEEIATVFRGHGLRVLHDTNLYDYPAYNGSYTRSNAAVQGWLEQYPSISIILDVHRDALVGRDGQVYKLVTEEAGEKMAQVMFVMGSDEAVGGHPGWKDNLALAVRLQQELERGFHSLARPIVLRSKTYNQELLPGSLLVEVGGHGNSLTEAITGARLWADNVARTILTLMEEEQK